MKKIDVVNLAQELGRDLANAPLEHEFLLKFAQAVAKPYIQEIQRIKAVVASVEESVEDAANTMRCAAERLSDERWRADRQLQNLLATDEPDNSGEWVQL